MARSAVALCSIVATLSVSLLLGAAAPQRPAGGPATNLPPISWTCPMHPAVMEDTKGKCPVCQMDLEAVRLDAIWTCPLHGVIAETRPGACPICRRDLIQVTVALSWTCPGRPNTAQLEPGKCADGTAMVARHVPWAHGNHNPQHGGQFFMAPDNSHHIEGTFPAADRFRMYVYDDYSKPLVTGRTRQVKARLVTKETFDPVTRTTRELAWSPLVLTSGGFFEAKVDRLALPAKMTAKVTFGSDGKESRFDFTFDSHTADPVPVPAPARGAPAIPAAPPGPAILTEAAATTDGLLADLKAQEKEIGALIETGALGGIFVPALKAKDLALEIEARQRDLPAGRRSTVETRVKQLVAAAWMLDMYGDLGDGQQIAEAYRLFGAAVAALDSAVVPRR